MTYKIFPCGKDKRPLIKDWHKSSATRVIGREAKTIRKSDPQCPHYYDVMINGKTYLVHRLIYFIETNEWAEQVDHIDGNGLNNNFSNLRGSTQRENQRNRRSHREGRLPNVYFCKHSSLWRARFVIRENGKKKRLCLGRYLTESEAYKVAEQELKRRGLI